MYTHAITNLIASVRQFRIKVLAAAIRRHVEHVPHCPRLVEVARVAALDRVGETHLRAPEMADLAALLDKDIRHRRLTVIGFTEIISVVGIARR